MAEPDTTELLRQILLELRMLNRNLGLQRGGGRLDVKYADENTIMPQPEPTFGARSRGRGEKEAEGAQGVKGVRDAEEPNAFMEDSLKVDKRDPSQVNRDHVSTSGAGDGSDMPTTGPSPALMKIALNDGISLVSGTGVDHSKAETTDLTFRYHWNGNPGSLDDLDEDESPSKATQALWRHYLGSHDWAIPADVRVPLTLHSPYLMWQSDEEAEAILRKVYDLARELESGPAISRLTIDDYVAAPVGDRTYISRPSYRPMHPPPEYLVTIAWDAVKYPSKDCTMPWRRFM
jgi:hypothetical protein